MCTVLLSLGVNPTAGNKYIYLYLTTGRVAKHERTKKKQLSTPILS